MGEKLISAPKDSHEIQTDKVWWLVLLIGSAAFLWPLACGFSSWRIHHFPHAVATVAETWEEQAKIHHIGRGALFQDLIFGPRYETITMGEIRFTREHAGKTYDCILKVKLGVPSDPYHIWDRLDVVPAMGTCGRVDVVGRVP